MLKLLQKFVKLSGGYVPVEEPWPGCDVYVWDEAKQRIVPIEQVNLDEE